MNISHIVVYNYESNSLLLCIVMNCLFSQLILTVWNKAL